MRWVPKVSITINFLRENNSIFSDIDHPFQNPLIL